RVGEDSTCCDGDPVATRPLRLQRPRCPGVLQRRGEHCSLAHDARSCKRFAKRTWAPRDSSGPELPLLRAIRYTGDCALWTGAAKAAGSACASWHMAPEGGVQLAHAAALESKLHLS